MEKFSTFNTDKKHSEVIDSLDCCKTCESATFSVNNQQTTTNRQQPIRAVKRCISS